MKRKRVLTITALLIFLCGLAILLLRNNPKQTTLYPDLLIQTEPVSAEQNGFAKIEEAGKALPLSDEELVEVFRLLDRPTWDEEEARVLLQRSGDALQFFDESSKYPRIVIPSVDSLFQKIPYLQKWKHLSQLKALRARFLFESGKEDEAFEELISLMHAGHRIQGSHGGLVHYAVGVSVKRTALTQWIDWVARTSLPEHTLRTLSSELDNFRPDMAALSNVIKVEFKVNLAFLNGIESGEVKFRATPQLNSAIYRSRVFLNHKETADSLAEFARASSKLLDLHYSEIQSHPEISSIGNKPISVPRRMLSGNLTGVFVLEYLLPSHKSIWGLKCREESSLSAAQTVLAVQLYKRQHGDLPETLNNLVPEYLDSLPIDHFDGQPLRYSRERRIIYSINKDLEDSGGEEKLDLVFPIY